MNSENPYQSPSAVSAQPTEPSPPGSELSQDVLRALRKTRWILWTLIAIYSLWVLYVPFDFIGLMRASRFFDNSRGYYTGLAFLGLIRVPLALIFVWRFVCFERALRQVISDGRLERLAFAQKQLFLILTIAWVSYLLISSIGEKCVIHFCR